MKARLWGIVVWLNDPTVILIFRLGFCVGLLIFASHVYADEGIDYLQNTTGNATATLSGTGKKWIYIIEGVSSLIAYHATKKIWVLGSCVVAAIFVDLLLVMAR